MFADSNLYPKFKKFEVTESTHLRYAEVNLISAMTNCFFFSNNQFVNRINGLT